LENKEKTFTISGVITLVDEKNQEHEKIIDTNFDEVEEIFLENSLENSDKVPKSEKAFVNFIQAFIANNKKGIVVKIELVLSCGEEVLAKIKKTRDVEQQRWQKHL
jgi:hypothetical protein